MGYIKPIYYNTLDPYKKLPHEGIQYTVCCDYNHISRYKGLRQVIHYPEAIDRFVVHETANAIASRVKFIMYEVPLTEENRLDLIAYKFYGSAQYSWLISYFNDIEDGFTVQQGQKIRIVKNFNDLFNNGEILAPISPFSLNLGEE